MAGRGAHTHGVPAWTRAAEHLLGKLERAAQRGIDDGLAMIEKQEKHELRRRVHPPGTPTNSPPGEPPALVTGRMHDAWRTRDARQVGAHRFRGSGGNPSVQARIQERGGWTGAGHRTKLPPRPYLSPAIRAKEREVFEGFKRRYTVVILSTNV